MYRYRDIKKETGLKIDQFHTILDYLGINWHLGKGSFLFLDENQNESIKKIVEEHGVGNQLCQWLKQQNAQKKYSLDSANQLPEKRRLISQKLHKKAESGYTFGFVNIKPEERWNYKGIEEKRIEEEEKQKRKYGKNWKELTREDKIAITHLKNGTYKTKNITNRERILKRNPGYVIWHDTKWQSKNFLFSLINSGLIKTSKTDITRYYLVSEKEIAEKEKEIDKLFNSYKKRSFMSGKSYQEDEIAHFLSENGISFKRYDRKTLYPKELDFFIEDKKVAIEFDGLYWHSEENLGKTYQLEKTELCEKNGIRLIHIFEDDWNFHQQIIKSIVLSALGIYNKKIYARKCIFEKIDAKEGYDFFEKNHVSGALKTISEFYGLKYNGQLVECIQIGKSRFEKGIIELLRMATLLNTQVIGGFSKLMKNQPYNFIVSYVDRSLYNGTGYIKTGWEITDITRPAYFYFKTNGKKKRENRMKYQKHKLASQLEDFDQNLSEAENMKKNGYSRIFDCGNYKLIWRRNK